MRDELPLKGLAASFHGFLSLAGLSAAILSALAAASYAPVAARKGSLGSTLFFAAIGAVMITAAGYEARRTFQLLREDGTVPQERPNPLGMVVAAVVVFGAVGAFGVAFFVWKTSR